MSEDFEELEQIPWAALAATSPSPRNRYLITAAGVVLIVVAAVWMATRSNSAAAVSLTSPAPPSELAIPEPTYEPVPEPDATIYSEADLMLIDGSDEERLAVMQAEWLVRDLLTVDGDPLIEERIGALLPSIDRSGDPAYAEWVRAFSIESLDPGRYRVEVAYRILSGTESGYVRQPAGAMAVEVAIDVDGSAVLGAAPEPVSLPQLSRSPD